MKVLQVQFKRWFLKGGSEERDRLSILSVKNLSKGKYADRAGLWLVKTTPDQG